ncbi:hypothetical protein D9M68_200190 [compost metagenome]
MQNIPAMLSTTLQWRSASFQLPAGSTATAAGVRVSRSLRHMNQARMKPGSETITNTQRHDGTTSSNWVAMMGASPRPRIGKKACWMPMFSPRRDGCEASAVAAMAVGVKAPSETPITARISSSAPTPVASPDTPASRENSSTAGISTLRRPIRSDNRPISTEEIPQAMASTAEMLPRS